MNTDFLSWFLQRHWFVAFAVMPEVELAWSLWQRWYWFSALCALAVAGKAYQANRRP